MDVVNEEREKIREEEIFNPIGIDELANELIALIKEKETSPVVYSNDVFSEVVEAIEPLSTYNIFNEKAQFLKDPEVYSSILNRILMELERELEHSAIHQNISLKYSGDSKTPEENEEDFKEIKKATIRLIKKTMHAALLKQPQIQTIEDVSLWTKSTIFQWTLLISVMASMLIVIILHEYPNLIDNLLKKCGL